MSARKQVTQVTLKNGEKIIVSLDRGNAARQAMIAGSGVWTIPEQNNRIVSVPMLAEVNDVWIEDVQVQLGEQLERAKRIEASGQKVEATATSPGYIKFLVGNIRLRLRHGGSMHNILSKINDEQRPLVNAELTRQGVDFSVK